MSRFSEIEAFIQVCELNSFTQAAEKLMLSRSRISQLVGNLEDRLSVRLIKRTTRSMILTPEGEQFLSGCRQGMQLLATTEANLKMMSARLSGPVHVNSVGGIFGETILAKALCEVAQEHPELSVTITYSSAMVDINKNPIDLTLRIGISPGDNIDYVCLGDVHHRLCASPKFLGYYGLPQTLEDLQKLPAVCGTPMTWELEHVRTGERRSWTPKASWRSGSTQAQIIAVEQGLGVGQLLQLAIESNLDEGRLIPILPEWRVAPRSLWLIWSNKGNMPQRTRVVRNHLQHYLVNVLNNSGN